MPTILSQHGSTLTALHLHEREDSWYALRETLSLEELKSIREACPHLKELTCDLNRVTRVLDVGDYHDIMQELAKFNLDNLQIYFDCGLPWLGAAPGHGNLNRSDRTGGPREKVDPLLPDYCDGDDDYEEGVPTVVRAPPPIHNAQPGPSVTVQPPSSNREICRFTIAAWKAVFGSQTTGSRRLYLKFGEVERKTPVLPRYSGSRNMTVWCRAKPHERDDKQQECFVEIDCCGGQHKRKFTSCCATQPQSAGGD